MSRYALAVALVSAVCAAQALKRSEMSPVPFTFAARYGRSPERQISPRHDRWMFSSRYGKRSSKDDSQEHKEKYDPPFLKPPFLGGDLETPLFLQYGHEDPPFSKGEKQLPKGGKYGGAKALYCEYTGVLSLYNCSNRRKSAMDIYARRNDASTSHSDEV